MPKIPEKWRWRIAYALDHSRRLCWPTIVTWAQDESDYENPFGGVKTCREDLDSLGCCWCGKFRKDTEAQREERKQQIQDRFVIAAAAVGILVAAIAIALGALYAASGTTPDHSTMTVCRPQYGNCTEATR